MTDKATLGDAMAKNWKVRAIMRTGGAETPMGALLLAIFKVARRGAPKWADAGLIDPDGNVLADFTPTTGTTRLAKVCTKAELQTFLYGIVTECKLTDAEGVALYEAAQNWVDTDFYDKEARENFKQAAAAKP